MYIFWFFPYNFFTNSLDTIVKWNIKTFVAMIAVHMPVVFLEEGEDPTFRLFLYCILFIPSIV